MILMSHIFLEMKVYFQAREIMISSIELILHFLDINIRTSPRLNWWSSQHLI